MLATARVSTLPVRPRGNYGSPGPQGLLEFPKTPLKTSLASTTPSQARDPIALATYIVEPPPTVPKAELYARSSADDFVDATASGAAVIQIWEGTVLSVDRGNQIMVANLHAKIGDIADHTGEIELQWVADQDLDLVSPGAVFYLTLYRKRRLGGTIENSQELRFRRRPSWSRQQISEVEATAERMLAKLRARE